MADKRLTREQIDTVLQGMTGADLIEHIGDGSRGAKVAGDAFDAAAARLGITNGTRAMELVGVGDFAYLVGRLTEVMSLDSPKAEPEAGSPDSASIGT